MRGQFAVRGGILDVFAWNHSQPVRIELFGDEIESIRQFDLDVQTSVEHLDTCSILLAESDRQNCPLRDYIRKADVTINVNAGFGEARAHILAGGADLRCAGGFLHRLFRSRPRRIRGGRLRGG